MRWSFESSSLNGRRSGTVGVWRQRLLDRQCGLRNRRSLLSPLESRLALTDPSEQAFSKFQPRRGADGQPHASVDQGLCGATAGELARALAARTGQSITDAVVNALREQLKRETLRGISERCAALPDHDTRSPEEIIGFDEHGLPV